MDDTEIQESPNQQPEIPPPIQPPQAGRTLKRARSLSLPSQTTSVRAGIKRKRSLGSLGSEAEGKRQRVIHPLPKRRLKPLPHDRLLTTLLSLAGCRTTNMALAWTHPLIACLLPHMTGITTEYVARMGLLRVMKTMPMENILQCIQAADEEVKWWTETFPFLSTSELDRSLQKVETDLESAKAIKALRIYTESSHIIYPPTMSERETSTGHIIFSLPYGLDLTFSLLDGELDLEVDIHKGITPPPEPTKVENNSRQNTRQEAITNTKAAFTRTQVHREHFPHGPDGEPLSTSVISRPDTLSLIFVDHDNFRREVQLIARRNGGVVNKLVGDLAPQMAHFWTRYAPGNVANNATAITSLERVRWVMEGLFLGVAMMDEGNFMELGIFFGETDMFTLCRATLGMDMAYVLQCCWDWFMLGGIRSSRDPFAVGEPSDEVGGYYDEGYRLKKINDKAEKLQALREETDVAYGRQMREERTRVAEMYATVWAPGRM
ncbi:hypothetical protein BJ508DRAFT_327546 [Ascobolus immersus RN42]|uniref:Uncharacterized protein n=1 Tax=Ascobolus immersus RN42 TaxID=1160509 RepID=A0A3N4I6C4_ASCIM|nr:hypothetical protein BJ508DRAFT_327546 [Ascobolus immersus RN42]